MFKKFTVKEDVASNTIIKSSTQRAIRAKLSQQFPALNHPILLLDHPPNPPQSDSQSSAPTVSPETPELTLLEFLWPKKESLNLLKCREHVSILVCKKTPLFFQHFDGPYFPTLKLLHQYPMLLPTVQVDRGAIKFVLSGANIMCPGLTSAGARLPPELPLHTPVAVLAQDKSLPCAVGFTQKSAADMRSQNKGVGVDNVHWLGDDLWLIDEI
ncbi:translation machinery-associated protein 20 [Puccinia graminis f. sp. tritici]|uniref:Translation machinery-associated protein 20 n=1 Tax=Puccinia graminis f. sp. tritici TaxID=56615 RepID=A0A5B0Q3B7_PUCGR|nr:translation machinery-associated protein 20 [Puccinia graminis f. sp. tritici]KAA1124584.1 translation machinery-associated protein 20 [Puccinia graminis f. sp. tritici]